MTEPEQEPETRSATDIKRTLESLIFVADYPVPERKLARAARSTLAIVRPILEELWNEYKDRGVQLQVVAGGYQFRSNPDNAPYVQPFLTPKPLRLTRAQLETMAIVAYRQPVTRPEIDDIRGVDSGSALRMLAERSLLKILGRKDEPGRPLLYGTTPGFLEFFGLASLNELPTLKEFSELSDESRALFERQSDQTIDLSTVEEEATQAEQQAQQRILEQEAEAQQDDHEAQEPEQVVVSVGASAGAEA